MYTESLAEGWTLPSYDDPYEPSDDDGEGWDSGYDSRKKSGQARRQNGKHSRNLKQSVQRAYAIEARQAQRGGGPRPQKS